MPAAEVIIRKLCQGQKKFCKGSKESREVKKRQMVKKSKLSIATEVNILALSQKIQTVYKSQII